jgi:hypothetical protein
MLWVVRDGVRYYCPSYEIERPDSWFLDLVRADAPGRCVFGGEKDGLTEPRCGRGGGGGGAASR